MITIHIHGDGLNDIINTNGAVIVAEEESTINSYSYLHTDANTAMNIGIKLVDRANKVFECIDERIDEE